MEASPVARPAASGYESESEDEHGEVAPLEGIELDYTPTRPPPRSLLSPKEILWYVARLMQGDGCCVGHGLFASLAAVLYHVALLPHDALVFV